VTFQRVGCEDLSHKPPSHEILPKSWANDLQFLVLATGAESNVSGAEAADEEDAGGGKGGGEVAAGIGHVTFQHVTAPVQVAWQG
jgi:hypothetical protein